MKQLVYIFLFFLFLSLYSCSKKTESIDEPIDSTALAIAVLPVYDCIPFYYAEQEGIFDSLGVNVRLVTYKSSMIADTAYAHGDVLGVVTDLVKASLWRSNGDSAKVVMSIDPVISLVTARASRLFQMSSIKERIVAITRHSILDYTADKMLAAEKMVSTDLNKPQINDIVLRTYMNDQDQYDGALLPEPYTSEAVNMYGAKKLKTNHDIGLHHLGALVFNDSTLSTRRDEVQQIVAAYQIAVDALNKNKTFPLSYIPKESTVDIPDTMFQAVPFVRPSLATEECFNDIITWLNGRKLIKSPTTYKSLFDSSFIKK